MNPDLRGAEVEREDDQNRDLGLGGRLSQSEARLLNRDGSFNIVRGGLTRRQLFHPYHYLLNVSWPRFFALVIGAYAAANALFAALYLACGEGAIGNARPGSFADAFYFSVQTLATIGYGKMTPESPMAHILVALEALGGLLGFALVTGLLFARFSRPSANIVFSRQALIAPYQGKTALMFRMANGRVNGLSDVRASVTMSWKRPVAGRGAQVASRSFHTLKLERDRVTFLALQWVVVHPIDEASPFHGVTEAEFRAADPEILVLVTAVDETFFQSASTRTSYQGDELIWGGRFRDIYERKPDGRMFLDVGRLHEWDKAE